MYRKLPLNDTFYKSLKYLKIKNDIFFDIKSLKSLQIIGFDVSLDDLPKIIPYFSSKFSPENFKRIQLKANVIENGGFDVIDLRGLKFE